MRFRRQSLSFALGHKTHTMIRHIKRYLAIRSYMLRLSREKATNRLGWQPVYDWHEAAAETVSWFKVYHEHGADMDMYDACVGQIARYVGHARELGVVWAL